MNWYQHQETVDRLAAAYVLGTLQGPARRRYEALLPRKTMLRLAVEDWTERLAPMLTDLQPMQPSRALWQAVSERTAVKNAVPDATKPLPLWRRFFSAIPASALAMGVMLGVLAPTLWNAQPYGDSQAQLPASYVGVLGTATGQPGLIVSSLRHGKFIDVKQVVAVSVPQGMQLHVWRIDAAGNMLSLGPIPSGKWVQVPLPEPAERLFSQAVELAVSVERVDAKPVAPQLPFVYRGLCGKLWK